MSKPGHAKCLLLLCVTLPTFTFVTSCREGIIPADAIMHPTAENLPPPGGPLIRVDTLIRGLSDPERAAAWAAARRALLDARTVTSVGRWDGTGPDVLGVVGAAASDGKGNVYIQDNSTEEVLVFSAAGEFMHRVGGKGEGPEEFSEVRGFVRLPDGRLVVGQWERGGPAKVLEPGPERYRFAGPLLPDPSTGAMVVNDLCNVHDRLFIHSTSLAGDTLVIHEVSVDEGRVVASFGESYRSQFAMDRRLNSYGSIACGEEPTTLVWGFFYFPIVKAYRPDNTLVWAASIEDFVQTPVYQNNPTERSVHLRRSPAEHIVGAHALRPGFVVLQTALLERPAPGEERETTRIRTYLVDQATGNGGLVSDSLPWIAWIGDSTFVAGWSAPYPRVEVRLMPRVKHDVGEENSLDLSVPRVTPAPR